jgi:hypothetical protein
LIDRLLARGAKVELAFSKPHRRPFGRPRFDGVAAGLTVHAQPFPRRRGRWVDLAKGLRKSNDYLRYLDPSYGSALFLRHRAANRLPAATAWLKRSPQVSRAVLRPLRAAAAWLERLVPSAPELDDFLAEIAPDLVLVSPQVDFDSHQVDLVKAARKAGRPVGLCIGSWDHLTSKGQVHVKPDRTFVWNAAQKREARTYHGLKAEEVEVVGASAFDKWFGRQPQSSPAELRARLGLPAGRPFVIYACSASQICETRAEADFVQQWLAALRRHPRLDGIGVVIRPHPQNMGHWRQADPARFPGAVLHPRAAANPIDAQDKAEYFDSLFHCSALVGINTSAMVEAAIIGRPPLTVLADQFNQRSTLHFHHLLPENGGCLVVARDLDEHLGQLALALDLPGAYAERLDGFVERFIRPCGRERPAADRLAEAALKLVGG